MTEAREPTLVARIKAYRRAEGTTDRRTGRITPLAYEKVAARARQAGCPCSGVTVNRWESGFSKPHPAQRILFEMFLDSAAA